MDHATRIRVAKAIEKVSSNPLGPDQGGYGKPLRNAAKSNLAGLFKIKLRSVGIRVVYKTIVTEREMKIIVVGARADDVVYALAARRRKKYGL